MRLLFASLAASFLLAGCEDGPTFREQQVAYAKQVALSRVEMCLGGVTYYSFFWGYQVVAVAPKYSKIGKLVFCDGAD